MVRPDRTSTSATRWQAVVLAAAVSVMAPAAVPVAGVTVSQRALLLARHEAEAVTATWVVSPAAAGAHVLSDSIEAAGLAGVVAVEVEGVEAGVSALAGVMARPRPVRARAPAADTVAIARTILMSAFSSF
jgi:hypothetical protein